MLPEVVDTFLINDYYDYDKEKKLLITSDDYGCNFTAKSVQKDKRFGSELASHEPAIQAVQAAGQQLIDVSQLGGAGIEQRLKQLMDVWDELKGISYQQFLTKIDEEELWISAQQLLDFGDNMSPPSRAW